MHSTQRVQNLLPNVHSPLVYHKSPHSTIKTCAHHFISTINSQLYFPVHSTGVEDLTCLWPWHALRMQAALETRCALCAGHSLMVVGYTTTPSGVILRDPLTQAAAAHYRQPELYNSQMSEVRVHGRKAGLSVL